LRHPLALPGEPGDWVATLRTTWVEPAYVELDGSWCLPGGEPATPLGNGGAFGGKTASPAPAAARRLADHYQRPVRVLLSREDVVRLGPKRPPIAGGVRADGTGIIRVVRTEGIADAIHSVAPGLEVEEIDVVGPPTSSALRGAGWVEAAVLLAAAHHKPDHEHDHDHPRPIAVAAPGGGRATAVVEVDADGRPVRVKVTVACGAPLDEIVLRSYCVGAAHMALGWVCSEGIAVDEAGVPQDLTVRSFGVLRAVDTPPIEVRIEPDAHREPVNGSDAVFAAVSAATWMAQGRPPEWPTMRGRFT
jgi:CO/xanthine dehydrogenase Mo-binding subunit